MASNFSKIVRVKNLHASGII